MRCKFLIFWGLIIGVSGCGQQQAQNPASQQAVAQVNNYTITIDDFKHEAGFLRPVFHNLASIPPAEIRLGILDEMINRELLLEEAQRINIDKDPEFMRQIENFWRLSLIKQLLKYKLAQIQASTTVSNDEIRTEYGKQKAPMASIKAIIFRRKVQKALQDWEDSLKSAAVIKRYYEILNTVPLDVNPGGVDGKAK